MEKAPDGESAVGRRAPKDVTTSVMPLPTDIPVAGPVAIPSGQDDVTTAAPADQHYADAQDTHRIEKQWVERAKKIIAQTKDDPQSQKHEMSLVKAEYIRKRFNKTIPTDDTAAA